MGFIIMIIEVVYELFLIIDDSYYLELYTFIFA